MLAFAVTELWADRLFAWSNAFLIFGAVVVLIGTIGSVVMASVREQFSNERISANEAETAVAKRGAAEANARALEAQVALEKFKAPRQFSAAQQAQFTHQLTKFAHVKADVFLTHGTTPDAAPLSISIRGLLRAAGLDAKVSNLMGGPNITGIVVAVRQGANANTVGAATAIVQELRAAGIDSALDPNSFNKNPVEVLGAYTGEEGAGHGDIWVVVGSKPQ